MSPVTIQTLLLGSVLFAMGMVGFLTRKNLILIFLSVELMLAGVATNFIAFGMHHSNYQGQLFAILILTVASCEAAIALALVVALYRRKNSLDIGAWSALKESTEPVLKESKVVVSEPVVEYPHLTPAGIDPLTTKAPSRITTTDSEIAPNKA
ncbi:MAG: NADH-quinone oxidoreductase subunit [Planctomycetota bacterium]|jgi:NADH-quinone oxidoreductase subunit K